MLSEQRHAATCKAWAGVSGGKALLIERDCDCGVVANRTISIVDACFCIKHNDPAIAVVASSLCPAHGEKGAFHQWLIERTHERHRLYDEIERLRAIEEAAWMVDRQKTLHTDQCGQQGNYFVCQCARSHLAAALGAAS